MDSTEEGASNTPPPESDGVRDAACNRESVDSNSSTVSRVDAPNSCAQKEEKSAQRQRPCLTDEYRRHFSSDSKLGWSEDGPRLQRWVIVLLIVSPIVVVGCTILIVFSVLPYVAHTNKMEDDSSNKENTQQESSSDDPFIRFISGVSVAIFLLVLLILGIVIACVIQQRRASNYGIDDGLLSALSQGDIVTLTKLHKDRGEYRIDLSSGELNTAIDVVDKEDYCSSLKKSKHEGNATSPRESMQVQMRSHHPEEENSSAMNWRNSSRNASYKRAIESKTFSEYFNRPESVLLDVNKFIEEKKDNQIAGKLAEEISSDDLCHGELNSSPLPRIAPVNASSTLVSRGVASYGSTLGRSRLLSSVDDDGYHFDNIGFSDDSIKENELPIDQTVTSSQQLENIQEDVFDDSIMDAVDKLEKDLQQSPHFGSFPKVGDFYLKGADSSSSLDGKQALLRRTSSDRILTRQNSLHDMLPHQRSFDKYLSLVRLDSTSSLSPVNEETAASKISATDDQVLATDNKGTANSSKSPSQL